MKTLYRKAGIAGIIIGMTALASLSYIAFAQNTLPQIQTPLKIPATLSPADLIPSNIDLVEEINTNEKNPFDKTINMAINQIMTQEQLGNNKDFVDKITKILAKNQFTIAIRVNENAGAAASRSNSTQSTSEQNTESRKISDSDIYAFFNVTNADFNDLLQKIPNKPQSEQYRDVTIYNADQNLYFANLGNLFILSPSRENLAKLIDNYSTKSADVLKNNSDYNEVRSQNLPQSFWTAYINPQMALRVLAATKNAPAPNLPTSTNMDLFNMIAPLQNVIEAMRAEGVSAAQTDNGYLLRVAVKGDKDKLTSRNLTFDRGNFVPELYKNVSGKNLIYYSEASGEKSNSEELKKLFDLNNKFFQEIAKGKADFEKNSGINIEKDVAPLMQSNILMALHKTDQIYPAITIMYDVKSDPPKAAAVLSKLDQYIKNQMTNIQREKGIQFYTDTSSTVDGVKVYDERFDITKLLVGLTGKDANQPPVSYLQKLPPDKTQVTLRMVVTKDGLMILTTHPDPGSIIQNGTTGLTENTGFNDMFTNRNEKVSGISYMDFQNLSSYLQNTMAAVKAPQDTINAVKNFLAPARDMYGKGTATPDLAIENAILRVDPDAVSSALANLIESAGKSATSSSKP